MIRKITFGIRNLPIPSGFIKYPETLEIDKGTLGHDLAYDTALDMLKKHRVLAQMKLILDENQDENLLLLDDDVYVDTKWDWESLNELTYLPFAFGEKGKEFIMAHGTCFYLPKRLNRVMRKTLGTYGESTDSIDVFIHARLPPYVKRQALYLDGIRHHWSDEEILILRVKKNNGAIMINCGDWPLLQGHINPLYSDWYEIQRVSIKEPEIPEGGLPTLPSARGTLLSDGVLNE